MNKKWITIFTFFLLAFVAVIYIISQSSHVKQITYKTILNEHDIPKKYVSIYKEAANKYDIPWKLLASVHRVETTFSTMDPLVSPAGALGHFQFMPRTWVGWTHPGSELGKIDEHIDITDISLIQKHNGYGVDVAGKGKADPFDVHDATYAAAKYLADHGAAAGEIENALFAYNHSEQYVQDVLKYYYAYLDYYTLIDVP